MSEFKCVGYGWYETIHGMKHRTCAGGLGGVVFEIDHIRIVAAIYVIDTESPFVCEILSDVGIFCGKVEPVGRRLSTAALT